MEKYLPAVPGTFDRGVARIQTVEPNKEYSRSLDEMGVIHGNPVTNAIRVTTLNQNLKSGFYAIHALDSPNGHGCPVGGDMWYHVIVAHHENGSAFSGHWAYQQAVSLTTGLIYTRIITNHGGQTPNPQYGTWRRIMTEAILM